jgi:hypothetical protein
MTGQPARATTIEEWPLRKRSSMALSDKRRAEIEALKKKRRTRRLEILREIFAETRERAEETPTLALTEQDRKFLRALGIEAEE